MLEVGFDGNDVTEKNSNQVLEDAFPARGHSMCEDTDRKKQRVLEG